MDDFNLSCLTEAKNEYAARLVNILTPCVHDGIQSIFQEAWNLCDENDERSKYLVTFQNFLARIPKWNQAIIEEETVRIIETSGCTYLEDLVTCVHIIQLKVLTSIRVGMKQKKLELDVPQVGDFIHRIYIAVARKLYKNVYLLERGVSALQTQRNQRELEYIIRESILNTIRDSIPTDRILRAYIDPSTEIEEEIEEREYMEERPQSQKGGEKGENHQDSSGNSMEEDKTNTDKADASTSSKELFHITKEEPDASSLASLDISSNSSEKTSELSGNRVDTSSNDLVPPSTKSTQEDTSHNLFVSTLPAKDDTSPPSEKKPTQSPVDTPKEQTLQFNDIDQVLDMGTNKQETVQAPKTVERLEQLGATRDQQRRAEEEDDEEPLKILDDVQENLHVEDLEPKRPKTPPIELDIEELPI